MQTILGSGGATGIELAKALLTYTEDIRLVSRHPEKVNPTDHLVEADLTDAAQTDKAVQGSEVVYLTVGLPYDADIWESTWPKIMQNVLNACNNHDSRLVFFDNVYMYDPDYVGHMTEKTPVNPKSRKGKVREELADMVMDRVKRGEVEALIARSADFYGPSIQDTSVLTEMVLDPLAKGNKANWLGSTEYKHSFTYTPDAGKATALLGNNPEAYKQVWHLPTDSNPPTGEQWIQMIADELGVEPKYRTAPRFLVNIMGWFNALMSEMVEMMYQYDQDYVFDSSKFESEFEMYPTSYEEGVKEIVKQDYS